MEHIQDYFGALLPICSRGTIPLGIGLVRSGAAKGTTLSFMTSSPAISVVPILLGLKFLGGPLMGIKLRSLVCGAAVAVLGGQALACGIFDPVMLADFKDPRSPDIKWPLFMAEQDLVWEDGVGDTWGDSAFIANGLTGASIYRKPGDDWVLQWELGRTDVAAEFHIPNIDWSIPRVPIGSILLDPIGTVKKASMRLDIWNAEARGRIDSDEGRIYWRSFIERESNVVVVEMRGTGGEKGLPLGLAEKWSISPRIMTTGTDPATLPLEQLPPRPYREQRGDLTVVVQSLTEHGAHATAFVNIPGKKGRNTFLLSVGKAYAPEKPQADNIEMAVAEAVSAIQGARADGVEALSKRHREWWHRYMQQAFVEVDGDDFWEQFYWLQIYKFGGASRADLPILTDNMGPWFTQCGWPGTWWNLNIQLSYFPAFSGNRLDVGRSMITAIDHFDQLGRFNSAVNPDAITWTRTSTYNLIRREGGDTYELGNLTWALHNYWRYWKYSMDETVGRNLFALLRKNINYYFDVMSEDTDGTIHLPPMVSPEYNFKDEPEERGWAMERPGLLADTNYSLQLFDWGLGTLFELNERFGMNDPMVGTWADAKKRLRPFPVNEHGLMVGAGQGFDVSHRHYSHLMALYPLHTVNPEQGAEAEALMRISIERWLSLPSQLAAYSFTGSAAMFATLGDGERALEQLDGMISSRKLGTASDVRAVKPNTMYAEDGGPVIETPLSVVESMGYMMLQSWGGAIRVFPAMPARWEQETIFHQLRTEGGFLVSAEWSEGKTQWILIESLAGEPCVLQTDIQTFKADRDVAIEPEEGPRGIKRWRIGLEKGGRVLLRLKK
ncbi:hypothetical protein PDESU_03964 [Pontiella desulfatans]|uniref:Glycosyl hydrolase family 95 N-terminal domain-containing protein n=1 Tax=Pontiella desulfatans TaxID=2750659 RepID=A0A6C2U774_PONDE|nr:permease [Pontiella desulfatans]VGO15381.1 hypothetical protein PDESU_03964 [Pontiella desulfatans]